MFSSNTLILDSILQKSAYYHYLFFIIQLYVQEIKLNYILISMEVIMKKEIEVFDYANVIMKAVKSGVLLTTKTDDKVNSMTISWGTLGVCGTKSGHVSDKINELGLSLEEPNSISVPGIKELPLTLECKVIYKQKQDDNEITEEIKNTCYPQDVDSSFHGANKDFHIAYYGEIVSAYIIE